MSMVKEELQANSQEELERAYGGQWISVYQQIGNEVINRTPRTPGTYTIITYRTDLDMFVISESKFFDHGRFQNVGVVAWLREPDVQVKVDSWLVRNV